MSSRVRSGTKGGRISRDEPWTYSALRYFGYRYKFDRDPLYVLRRIIYGREGLWA
jgi:hypothetical protein